ncbi:mitogen-activated protein kinase kinase kinase 2-like [Physella acuta]|uniref:mitogen-activated protein kinase kinase kinase 2-like n=1 Tax=Physella acuta TaxID=109671 RepID=UPI0027DD1312|nr:mitogen-activated protein kinase kinase kinase 2-like [Physella acuta]
MSALLNATQQLMTASKEGDEDTIKLLIENGCDVNAIDSEGCNPLMLASFNGHEKPLELLIKSGCDFNAFKRDGFNALMMACEKGHDKCVELLIKYGCHVNATNSEGCNALMLASVYGHEKTLELLIKSGCDVNAVKCDGFNALMLASEKGHLKSVELLVNNGCEVNAVDSEGCNSLMLASIYGHDTILMQLIKDSFYHYPVPKIWKLGRQMGRGSFGEVCVLIDENNPNDEKFVVKKQNVEEAKKDKNKNLLELQILLKIEHKRIVSFYGFIFEDNYLNLIFECLKKGTLRNFVHCNHPLTEVKIKRFTRQILEGLSYLHNCKPKIIHRDIKGSNIFLDDEENIKLADFGLSRLITLSSAPKTDGVGTNKWMAPEVMDPNNETYDEKADIWSTGCTVVEMATKEPPFAELNNAQVIIVVAVNKVKPKYDLPENSSEELKMLLKTVFKFKPDKRPSADKILNMDYFKETQP